MAEKTPNPFRDRWRDSRELPQPVLDGLAETYESGYEAGHKAGSWLRAQEISRIKAEAIRGVKDDRREREEYYLGVLATLRAKHPDITPDLPLEVLDLSERPINCLRREEVQTIGELSLKSADDLLDITNFGNRSLEEVIFKLGEMGLTLRGEEPNPA